MKTKKESKSPWWVTVVIGLVSGVALCSGLYSCSDQEQSDPRVNSTLPKIVKTKELKVAYIHYPPSAYKDAKTGEVKGLFVDMLSEIIEQLDPAIKIQFIETNWTDFSTVLNTNKADLSIAGTFTTVPRAKVVSFTDPIVYLGRSVVVKAGDERFSANKGPLQFDRSDIKIGVVSGEGSHEFVKANFKNQNNIVVFSGSDLSQCLAAVSAGQVDVGMSDALETQKYASAHSEVIDLYRENPYDLNPIAWAVRHEDIVWKNFLNTCISTLEASGKVKQWEKKYDFRWTHPKTEMGPR